MIKFNKNSQYQIIAVSALLFVIFYNFSFFKNVFEAYDVRSNILPIISVFVVFSSFLILLFSLFSSKFTTKPILIITFLASSFASYFMDSYNAIIDDDMLRNTMQTDIHESLDLLSLKLLFYVILLGIIPAIFIFKAKINYDNFKKELVKKLKIITICLVVILINIFAFSKFYTSFFREHKPLRYYSNPTYWIYSIGHFISKSNVGSIILEPTGEDAKLIKFSEHEDKKELIIMVVGEATRADRFSLNGYKRKTNPLLEKEKGIINFSNMHSCGTSTAISVPCMFSILDKDDYSYKKGLSKENALDVLNHTGEISILWRDNNSDSKGVATRVEYENFKTSKTNTICDEECRDEGMLVGLDEYIKKNKGKDILIILHQMGNHGPAYFKRYTKEFEKFTPTCKTNQLEDCTQEEISNAYDNAILHTDYFLSQTINFLKKYSNSHETAMFYISDHGESLGENGLYLHGLPNLIAPESQTHVASLIWIGSIDEDIDAKKLALKQNSKLSQDNVFHTLLGFFEVESKVYDKNMDILNGAKLY